MSEVHPNHSLILAAIVAEHPAAAGLTWEGAWHSWWDSLAIAAGTWDERCLLFINDVLGAALNNLADAQNLYARLVGFENWSALSTVYLLYDDLLYWGVNTLAWGDDDLVWLEA